MNTVAPGQYFVTIDEAELAILDGSCRECTLLHQGRYGIEIRIKSLFGDGSHSWIMIVNGLNEYVTETSEETQENRND